MDASYGNQGDSTAVSFPEFLVKSQAFILNFDYYMYGEDVESLLLQVCMKFSFVFVPLLSRSVTLQEENSSFLCID